MNSNNTRSLRLLPSVGSLVLAILLLIFAARVLSAQELEAVSANAEAEIDTPREVTDLDGSSKTVDKTIAEAGDTVTYTIVLINSGDATLTGVSLQDPLPDNTTYVDGSLMATAAMSDSMGVAKNVITWTGAIEADMQVTITFAAELAGSLMPGATIENQAVVDADDIIIPEILVATTSIADADFTAADKSVDKSTAASAENLRYTITLPNDGDITGTVMVTDMLPTNTTYITDSLMVDLSDGATEMMSDDSNDTIVWSGIVPPDGEVTLTFDATLADELEDGTVITNTAMIKAGMDMMDVSAETTIQNEFIVLLPIVSKSLEAPTPGSISRPDSENRWVVSWNDNQVGVQYQLQESPDPTFEFAATFASTSDTQALIQNEASPNNEYWYRVRAVNNSGQTSEWVELGSVVGAYYDNFNDDSTGWDLRRTTFIEETIVRYEDGHLVLIVDDRWDWMIAAPMKQAPEPPYVIEVRSQSARAGNLLTQGIIYGGDWNGDPCIERGSIVGIYEDTDCFNHFYNTNLIQKGAINDIKLLWENVEELVWCPNCHGSPMKRLRLDENNPASAWPSKDPVPSTGADGWNIWRIEVRSDQMRMYVNGDNLVKENNFMRFYNDRYFGLFASTDEYNNSPYRFDWIRVTPLDE